MAPVSTTPARSGTPLRDVRRRDPRTRSLGRGPPGPRVRGGRSNGWHQEIAKRTAAVALGCNPQPSRVLDVGWGTGYLLRLLASRLPGALDLVVVDPAPSMVDVALGAQTGDDRIRIIAGAAEEVPFAESSSDLVVTTASFDHCGDQVASLRECARFLAPGELARTHRPLQILALADVAPGWERPGADPSEGHAPRDRGRVAVTCVAPDPCHHPPDCDRDPLKGIWRSLSSPEALAGARRRGACYFFEGPVGVPQGIARIRVLVCSPNSAGSGADG
jgi:SAM-dependent methyltransferase